MDEREGVERARMSAHEISWALRAVNRAAADVDHALAEHVGLRALDYTALDHVMSSEDRPLGPVELGARLGISAGSATEMVDRLERSGHVERRRGSEDRRRVMVTARPEGVARLLDDLSPLFTRMDILADSFDGDEQAVIRRYLREVSELLTDYARSLPMRPSSDAR